MKYMVILYWLHYRKNGDVNYLSKAYKNSLQVYAGLAIIFVVIVHVNAYYLIKNNLSDDALNSVLLSVINGTILPGYFPTIFNLIDKIAHVAVPMFIFIAGYKYELRNKEAVYKTFFFKKIRQVFVPFIAITLLYLAADLIMNRGVSVVGGLISFITGLGAALLGYNYAYQLWYVPLYLFIILTYPLIRKIVISDFVRMGIFIVLALVWVYFDLNVSFASDHPYPLCFIYFFYLFELGSLFCRKMCDVKILSILTFVGLLLISIFIPTLLNVVFTEVVFVPVAVIAFFYFSELLTKSRLLLVLGRHSFSIFLFHAPIIVIVVMQLVNRIGLSSYYIILPIACFTIILLSMFASVLIGKVPLINQMFNLKKSPQ